MVNKLGVFDDWKDQIPGLVKLSTMIIEKQSELLDQGLSSQNSFLSERFIKKLSNVKLTNEIASFLPWFEKSELILAKVQYYQQKNYELSTRSDSFPFDFLKTVTMTATQRHQRVVPSNSA